MELHLPQDRQARLAYIRTQFPEAEGPDGVIPGGRQAAWVTLNAIDPVAYSRTRNYLSGRVTRLSPYLRHGCLTLPEVLKHIKARFKDSQSYKLIFELAWRDFWRRLWKERGNAIRQDIEPPKVRLGNSALPSDIQTGTTGLPCIDTFVDVLTRTGYLHNHARMWFAAYCIHYRGVRWQDAADWFLGQLIDGDLASNHLSWQWVASTFSHKPYIFNQENLARYTDNCFCQSCSAVCPFKGTYEELTDRLFGERG